MVSANQLIWWIDAAGILHSCAQIDTPPQIAPGQPGHYAQGVINPVIRAGTISHVHSKPATLQTVPRELFDVLDARFPNTRWWIPDHQSSKSPTPRPIPAHS
jgi:hypothetical protein